MCSMRTIASDLCFVAWFSDQAAGLAGSACIGGSGKSAGFARCGVNSVIMRCHKAGCGIGWASAHDREYCESHDVCGWGRAEIRGIWRQQGSGES